MMRKVSATRVWLFTMTLLFLSVSYVLASHPGGNVDMRDVNGNLVTVSMKPYSTKMTCASPASSCHFFTGVGSPHKYESDIGLATKTQFRRSGEEVTYTVPYPKHGVTAGYHFQQGRGLDWNSTRRAYYGLAPFTSSPGMYGKY